MTEPSIPDVVARVRERAEAGATKPLAWRRRQLEGLERMLVTAGPQLEQAVWEDLRKSATEAQLTEIGVVVAEVRLALRHLDRWASPRRARIPIALAPATGAVLSEPLGTALVIGTWNYPIQLLLAPLVGALAAGDAVVLKPSELAPATADAISRLIPRFLDPDAVAVVTGDADTTDALLAEAFDIVFFTGSERVARIVAKAAAERLTPVILELGGKSPAFVDRTVDLDVAARRIAWGKFANAGQTCVAPDHVLATREVAGELAERVASAVREFYGDDPSTSDDYGRLVSDDAFSRLTGLLHEGRIVLGGDSRAEDRYLAPTVLVDVPHDAAIMQEEIFGPILPILAVDDAEDAIRRIRSRPKPLALYVFSHDRRVRRRMTVATSSGAIAFGATSVQLAAPDLPFGGVGASGMGSYHGRRSFDAFSHEKAILDKPLAPDTLRVAYPPYSRGRLALARRLLHRLG